MKLEYSSTPVRSNALAAMVVGVITVAVVVVFLVKLQSLLAWRYTSDLFIYDQAMSETLKGNIGVEYTYGNVFGGHAYFVLFLLLPLKWLLGPYCAHALLALSPLVFGVTAAVLLKNTYGKGAPRAYSLASLGVFLLTYGIWQGLHERVYGFHPDVLSGFLLVAYTSLRVMPRDGSLERRGWLKQASWALVPLLLFLLLKEEMIFLGIIYFGVAAIFRRSVNDLLSAVFCCCALIASVVFMRIFHSPFHDVAKSVDSIGPVLRAMLALDPRGLIETYWSLAFWVPVILYSAAFLLLVSVSKRRLGYAIALFVTGLVKLFAAAAVGDLNLFSWHGFPGLVMLSGALVIQCGAAGCFPSRFEKRFVYCLFGLSVVMFVLTDLPFGVRTALSGRFGRKNIVIVQQALRELKASVEPEKVTAIPQYTAIEWVDGYRFSSFPRGTYRVPSGIAEYAVVERSNTELSPHLEFVPLSGEAPAYSAYRLRGYKVIDANDHFILLKRDGSSLHNSQRDVFVGLFGSESLGKKGP
ncbi:MAG: DUF2079 domain-containing protein [Kiritimatiellae bacterium]|nr:DUF2079 domain-containing protein [Kiritimatiellia bacterium]